MTALPPQTDIHLSVIVPAYNESARIRPGLAQILDYLDTKPYSWELLVVDDGSRDDTAAIVTDMLAAAANTRLISYQPNRGKGHAVRTGVLVAQGKYIVFLDADMSTPVEEISPALAHLDDGHDMVVGSRRHPHSQIDKPPSFFRRFATAIFRLVRVIIVGLGQYSDTQCGFKAYRREAAMPIYQQAVINRFMFDVEVLYLAERSGLNIIEMPVHWADAEGSTVRLWPGVYHMIRDLLRIRWIHRRFQKSD